MSSVQIIQLLEILATYINTDITYTIGSIHKNTITISYHKKSNGFQISYSETGKIVYLENIDDAVTAILKALDAPKKKQAFQESDKNLSPLLYSGLIHSHKIKKHL